jgi:hypothetical protein
VQLLLLLLLLPGCTLFPCCVQVSLWLVLKQAESRKELLLPVSLFGLHLFLGNWWNGEANAAAQAHAHIFCALMHATNILALIALVACQPLWAAPVPGQLVER